MRCSPRTSGLSSVIYSTLASSRKVKDFMQNLQDLANTIGNLSDEDIVLAFGVVVNLTCGLNSNASARTGARSFTDRGGT